MDNLAIIILAAGKGKRMQSPLPKVLQCLAGRPLLDYVINTALSLSPGKIVVVIGHQGELVRDKFNSSGVEFVFQREQLGTGHAAIQAEPCINEYYENVLILSGDVPMIKTDTLIKLLNIHLHQSLMISFISTHLSDPSGYGRVVRDTQGKITGIIEEKDANAEIKIIDEINSGIYCFNRKFLFNALKEIDCDNEQKEYYLTDALKGAVQSGLSVGTLDVQDCREIIGINTREDLLKMENLF